MYVHGERMLEAIRLQDQAGSLVELLHSDTRYDDGDSVLEAGCGTGAQTITLARNSPGASFTSIDIDEPSLFEAASTMREAQLDNVVFRCADVLALPYEPESFDHVFVCFLLEHLARPLNALSALRRVLKPGGSLTVIEGDHGSAYFHPDSEFARRAIAAQVELQARAGGNANIGRQLFPLVSGAGFRDVRVSPRMVYADGSKPGMVDGFTRRTFTAMVEGVREEVLAAQLMTAGDFDRGIRDLYRTAEGDGVFCYTFFKGTAING